MIGPQASAGTAARFEAFYRGRYQEIAAYVRRRVGHDAADDVIANVFTVAWRRFGDVPGPPQDRPWLFAVARNTISDHDRAQRRWFRLGARLRADAAITARPAGPPGLGYEHETVLAALAVNAFELRYRRARHAMREAVANAAPVPGAREPGPLPTIQNSAAVGRHVS